jgi:probable addiction module antidote protein
MAKVSKFDAAEYLNDPEDIAIYLAEAFETGDASFITHALGTVARAKGMAKIAEEVGVGRESLYKSLTKDANPAFETVVKVLDSIGLKMTVTVKAA